MGGDGGQGGEDGQPVRPADDVEVVDLTALLAEAQALGEKEEVEPAPLGGPGQVGERREGDLAPGLRVAPYGVVVHAREVSRQDDLLGAGGGHGATLAYRLVGRE